MKKESILIRIILILAIILVTGCNQSPPVQESLTEDEQTEEYSESDPEQALEEYSFKGFTKDGRPFEVKGNSAEIFSEFIQMFQVRAQAFAEDGSVSVTATSEKGKMYMGSSNVRMEENVVITTPDGAELTTDYLDWAAQEETATTEAYVVVKKDNIVIEGDGAEGKTDLQEVEVKKNVKVTVYDQSLVSQQGEDEKKEPVQVGLQNKGIEDSGKTDQEESEVKNKEKKRPTVITCDGKLEIDYETNLAKFFDNVVLDDEGGKVYADRMDIYIDPQTKAVKKAIAMGNVKIEEASKVSYCEKAIYDLQSKKITLLPDPESSGSQVKVIIYPDEGGDLAPFGD